MSCGGSLIAVTDILNSNYTDHISIKKVATVFKVPSISIWYYFRIDNFISLKITTTLQIWKYAKNAGNIQEVCCTHAEVWFQESCKAT